MGYALSALFSFCIFGYLYGFQFLSPDFTAWMQHGDPAQHFYGFNFFLREPWQFPIGKISDYNWPSGTSVVYTDSIPLLSIFLKIFFQGATFQFHGWWILFCFLAQGVAGYWFAMKATQNSVKSFLIATLLTLFPPFLFRGFDPSRHYSLLAHFLMLIPLGLVLSKIFFYKSSSRKLWVFILTISLGVHFYFFLINLILWLGEEFYVVGEAKRKLVRNWVSFAAIFLGFALMMEAMGYFVIPVHSTVAGGFASYSMNLFSWLNSEGYAYTGLKLSTVSGDQREGFQYLGAGILFLMVVSLRNSEIKKRLFFLGERLQKTSFALIAWFLLFLALSVKLSFLDYAFADWITAPVYVFIFMKVLQKYHFSKFKALGLAVVIFLVYLAVGKIMRSSGRVGWYFSYSLIFILIYLRPSWRVLLLACVFQWVDVIPILKTIRAENQKLIHQAAQEHPPENLIEWLKGTDVIQGVGLNLIDLAFVQSIALKEHRAIGPVYVARGYSLAETEATFTKTKSLLLSGWVLPKVAYVTTQMDLIAKLEIQPKLQTLKIGPYLWIKSARKN